MLRLFGGVRCFDLESDLDLLLDRDLDLEEELDDDDVELLLYLRARFLLLCRSGEPQ